MKKYKHGKLVTGLTMGLVAASLVGVGFSTWIITAKDTQDQVGDITVDVAQVQDNSIILSDAAIDPMDNGVVFDGIEDNEKLIHCTTSLEDLTFKLSFKLTAERFDSFKGLTVAATETGTTLAGFVTEGYIVAPFKFSTDGSLEVPLVDKTWTSVGDHTVYYNAAGVATTNATNAAKNAKADINITNDGKVYTFKVTYTFAWGATFGSKNPVLEVGGAKIEELKLLQTSQVKFGLTIKHAPAGSDVTIGAEA